MILIWFRHIRCRKWLRVARTHEKNFCRLWNFALNLTLSFNMSEWWFSAGFTILCSCSPLLWTQRSTSIATASNNSINVFESLDRRAKIHCSTPINHKIPFNMLKIMWNERSFDWIRRSKSSSSFFDGAQRTHSSTTRIFITKHFNLFLHSQHGHTESLCPCC